MCTNGKPRRHLNPWKPKENPDSSNTELSFHENTSHCSWILHICSERWQNSEEILVIDASVANLSPIPSLIEILSSVPSLWRLTEKTRIRGEMRRRTRDDAYDDLRTRNNGTFLAPSDAIPETSWRQLLWYMISWRRVRRGADGARWTLDDSQANVSTFLSCICFWLSYQALFMFLANSGRKGRAVNKLPPGKSETWWRSGGILTLYAGKSHAF